MRTTAVQPHSFPTRNRPMTRPNGRVLFACRKVTPSASTMESTRSALCTKVRTSAVAPSMLKYVIRTDVLYELQASATVRLMIMASNTRQKMWTVSLTSYATSLHDV